MMRNCQMLKTFGGKKAKLSAVPVAFETEPELKNVVLELVPEPVFPRVLPLTVDDLERYVLHKSSHQRSGKRAVHTMYTYINPSMHGRVHVASI